jgi:hypothetical protein
LPTQFAQIKLSASEVHVPTKNDAILTDALNGYTLSLHSSFSFSLTHWKKTGKKLNHSVETGT